MPDPQTIIADVERLESEAKRRPEGPDYDAILEEVAAKHGVGSDEVRSIMIDHWSPLMGVG